MAFQLFQGKLICTLNQHCLSYEISNRLQFNSSLFFWKRFENCVALTYLFPRCAAQSKDVKVHKDRYIYLLWAIFEGTLVLVYQKNAPLRYKTACSESESRNFDCQWTLVSFLVKHNQFYREARLTCPFIQVNRRHMYKYLCIWTCVQRVAHFEKKCVNVTIFWTICRETKMCWIEVCWKFCS